MNITLNNQKTETTATTLSELAAELKLPAAGVAVAVNNRMIPREEWSEFKLTEQADITIIKAACGG